MCSFYSGSHIIPFINEMSKDVSFRYGAMLLAKGVFVFELKHYFSSKYVTA